MLAPDWWYRAEPAIDAAVSEFSERVRQKISTVSPGKLIRAKNPFLFCARVGDDAQLLTSMVLDAYVSSSEETMFVNVLEEIAIAICHEAKDGRKSTTANIDLEYDEAGIRTIAQIKSGPNWGNSRQRQKLVDDFQSATHALRQGSNLQVRAVEGVCYGPTQTKDLGTHIQLTGRSFWTDISGWDKTDASVLSIIQRHTGNGLMEARARAQSTIIEHLQQNSAVTSGNSIDWNTLLELVMSPRI